MMDYFEVGIINVLFDRENILFGNLFWKFFLMIWV